jgi:hypothetical protein
MNPAATACTRIFLPNEATLDTSGYVRDIQTRWGG